MKSLPLIALFALAGVAGSAAETALPTPLAIDDMTFEVRHGSGDPVEIRSKRGDGSFSTSLRRERLSHADGVDGGDGPVRFTVEAEAGRTECSGARRQGEARGTCRFVSSPEFETGLAQRGVPLQRRRDLLALALVDARLALVDDLSRDGLRPPDSGDLIAATALGITGAWAHDLREAGLVIDKFGDLIAARALNVDAGFVRAMAKAGYPHLTSEQVITMKAVGVTPDYAAAMNRASDAAHAVADAGGLQ